MNNESEEVVCDLNNDADFSPAAIEDVSFFMNLADDELMLQAVFSRT